MTDVALHVGVVRTQAAGDGLRGVAWRGVARVATPLLVGHTHVCVWACAHAYAQVSPLRYRSRRDKHSLVCVHHHIFPNPRTAGNHTHEPAHTHTHTHDSPTSVDQRACLPLTTSAATLMAIIAMSTQQWIVQDLHGKITYGECDARATDRGSRAVPFVLFPLSPSLVWPFLTLARSLLAHSLRCAFVLRSSPLPARLFAFPPLAHAPSTSLSSRTQAHTYGMQQLLVLNR